VLFVSKSKMGTIPEYIGKYHVLELLGRGGMGAVYKAEDTTIERMVAIKVLLTEFENDEMRKRFFSEARSTGRLKHPNIVTLYDMGDTEGSPFLVMEFVEGQSLDKVLSSPRKLTLLENLDIVHQVCSGLHYAHENQVIHRDVKPGNVVLLPDGQVKLVDFGIAKFGNDRHTRTGTAIGSIKYMSPEQITGGDIDRRSDVYSTGVLLFEMLTRRLPFEGDDIVSTMHKILTLPPPDILESIPDAPPKLGEIVRTALAKEREKRYQTADDFCYELKELQEVLKRNAISDRIQFVKEAIISRKWEIATEQLAWVRRVDQQNKEARELSREIRIFSAPQGTQERAHSLLEMATRAGIENRYDDVLRLCDLGIELEQNNTHLQQLRAEALSKSATTHNVFPTTIISQDLAEGATQVFSSPSGRIPSQLRGTAEIPPSKDQQASVSETSRATTGLARSKPVSPFGFRIIAVFVLILAAIAVATYVVLRWNQTNETSKGPSVVQKDLPSNEASSQIPPTPAKKGGDTSGKSENPALASSPASPKSVETPAGGAEKSSADRDAIEWKKIEQTSRISDLDQFIVHFPHSPFRTIAEGRREDLEWVQAREGGRAALSAYLTRHPTGRYSQQAREDLRIEQKPIETSASTSVLEQPPTPTPTPTAAQPVAVPKSPSIHSDSIPDPPSVDNKALIVKLLRSYEQAYSQQDVDAINSMWPNMPDQKKKDMKDMFKKMKSTHLTNDVLSGPDISGSSATAKLSQTIVFSLGGAPQSKSDKVTMDFRKSGSGNWYIDAIH
jgi:serine/threonine protein kinase